jgi:toxoflavin biosynthesis protein ToxD
MAEKVSKKKSNVQKNTIKSRSRALPILLAGFICALFAITGGYGAWYLFGVKANGKANRENLLARISSVVPSINTEKTVEQPSEVAVNNQSNIIESVMTPAPTVTPEPTIQPTPTGETPSAETKEETSDTKPTITEGTVLVKGGEVTTGGGKTEKPVKRTILKDFLIAETEVTNAQYAEFVADSKVKPPTGWNSEGFPEGRGDFPVTNISYNEAEAYCEWLANKLGKEVRLPTEPEWERAAKGEEDFIYPWGNTWDSKAAIIKGKVAKVKNFERNKSPYGAYDMAGNVWEMTSAVELNTKKEPVFKNGQVARIVRGGSAWEAGERFIRTTRWTVVSNSDLKNERIGFRYIIVNSN